MKNSKKYTIIIVSTIVVAGLGYFVYNKIKMSIINSKVSTISEAEEIINKIDVSDIKLPDDLPTEPTLPMPNPNFSKDSLTESIDDGGYY